MKLLGEGNGRIVVGQFTRLVALLVDERDSVVDVEDAVAAAGRPDGGGGFDAVLLGVDLAVEEGTAAGEGGAGGLLGIMLTYRLSQLKHSYQRCLNSQSFQRPGRSSTW
jgi:hypothetical protein